MLALYGSHDDHLPGCDCVNCAAPVVTLANESFDIRFRRIDPTIEQDFIDGVWSQDILPNRIDAGMWQEHYSRLLNNAQAGWGKSFSEADNLDEWNRFQRIQENLRQFAAHKQHRMVEELRALKAKFPNRADWEQKSRAVLRRHNRIWLKAELQASTAAAQAAESWQVFERRKYLYPNLKYLTAHDERVRESHRVLADVVRPVNDPFWDVYYPPNGWGCRCKVIQTDEEVTPGGNVDFDPPKGFRGNVGKTGQLFGQDHPYFDVPALDREALDRQSADFHAAVTKPQVQSWAAKELVPSFSGQWGFPQPVTVTNEEVASITAAPHAQAAFRNNLLYMLQLIGGNMKYLGTSAGEGAVQAWYYQSLKVGQVDYYFNLWRLLLDDGSERIGIHSITDIPPPIGGP